MVLLHAGIVYEQVLLQGQFDRRPRFAELIGLKYFANPVDKAWDKHEVQRQNPEAHLSWYQLYQPSYEKTRKITIENQFGQHEVWIGDPVALLVPALKSRTEDPSEEFEDVNFPEKLDHFKLYRVLQGRPLNVMVRLRDQVDGELGLNPEDVMVQYPIAFGVPVSKQILQREENFYPIRNKEAHLVIYNLTPQDVPGGPRRFIRGAIITPEDYQQHWIAFARSIKLAVPSAKLDVQ